MSGLPRLPNATRARTATVGVVVLDLPTGTVRASTRDLYPDGASVIGPGLVEQLLQTSPGVSLADRYRAAPELPDPDEIVLTLWNHDRRFTSFFQIDPRESLVRCYIYDEANPADEELVFVGHVEKPRFIGPGLLGVQLVCGAIRKALDRPFLRHPVTVEWFPAIQPEPVETSGEGANLADGWGVGLHVPMRYTRGPTFADPAPVYEFACLGTCEVDDARTNAVAPPYIEAEDFTVDLGQRYPDPATARAMTVLRFARDVPPDGLVATVTRNHRDVDADDVALWTFGSLQSGLGGTAWRPGTLTAFGLSDATTGELVAGPSGVGVAALTASTLAAPYWTSDDAGASQMQTLTVECRLRRPTAAAVGPVLWSGGGAHDGAASAGGWALRVGATGVLEVLVHVVGEAAPLVMLASPAPLAVDRWVKVAFTRDGTSGAMALRVDAAEVDTATDARAIDYQGGETPLVLGAAVTGGAPVFWAGGLTVSGLRLSQAARPATDLDDDYFRLRHSPIVGLRDLLTGAGETVDTASYETARAAVDAFDDGGLRLDGWIADDVTVRDVGGHVAFLTRASMTRTAANTLALAVPAPQASAVATFGFYPESEWRNARHLEADLLSVQEATKTLTTKYRLGRTITGSADTIQKERTREPVLPRGQDHTLELRLVHSHRTAALVAGRERIDRRRRDEARTLEVDHEGRPAVRGSVVHLDLGDELRRGHYDPADYDPDAYVDETLATGDYEVLARQYLPGGVYRLTVSPYDAAVYLPQPGTGIAVDPVIADRPALDLGTHPTLIEEAVTFTNGFVHVGGQPTGARGDGPRVVLRLALRSVIDLAPEVAHPSALSPGRPINNGPVTGAASRAAALAADDGDGSYIELDDQWTVAETTQAVTFGALTIGRGTVTAFHVEARSRYVSGAGVVGVRLGYLRATVLRPPSLLWTFEQVGAQATLDAPLGHYVARSVDLTSEGIEREAYRPWRVADVRAGDVAFPRPGDMRLAVRYVIPAGAVVRVGRLGGRLEVEQESAPPDLGGVLWYRKAITDPDAGVPPVVGVTTPLAPRSLAFVLDDVPPGGNQYDYWCALFDIRGRFARLLGPLRVIVF